MSKASAPFLAVALMAMSTVAFAGDDMGVLAPATDGSNIERPYQVSPQLFEPDYFSKQGALDNDGRKAMQNEVKGHAAAQKASEAAVLQKAQQDIDARMQNVLSQPDNYATRRAGLRAAPPAMPDGSATDTGGTAGTGTGTGAGGGVDGGQTSGGAGGATGGGGGFVPGQDTGGIAPVAVPDKNNSLMEQMMNAVQ